jgi:hypothetical protein
MYSELNKRLDRIDRGVQKLEQTHALAACNCRGRGKKIVETKFHTAEELEKILWVPCPVHGIREPGFVCFTPPWCLLKKPDLKFCTCPPHPWRDFVTGKRPKPTCEEEMEYSRTGEYKTEEERKAEFEIEHARLEAVYSNFEKALAEARGSGRE